MARRRLLALDGSFAQAERALPAGERPVALGLRFEDLGLHALHPAAKQVDDHTLDDNPNRSDNGEPPRRKAQVAIQARSPRSSG
jgi:hypothetical protein